MESKKINPKFEESQNPRVGLIALASDFIIEKDLGPLIRITATPLKPSGVAWAIIVSEVFIFYCLCLVSLEPHLV